MKRIWLMFFLVIGILFVMAGCNGGGGSDENENTTDSSATDSAVAVLYVNADYCVFNPAMIDDYIVHLSDGTNEVSARLTDIVAAYWNDSVVGFYSVDSSKGLQLLWDPNNPKLTIPGPDVSSTGGTVSFLTKDNAILTINTDEKWLIFRVDDGMIAERINGLIRIYPNEITPPVEPGEDPIHTISVANGSMQVTFATVDGYIVNLVKNSEAASLKLNDVSRVFWNGDVAGWSLKDTNKYSATLIIPTTIITVPDADNGIIRIVAKDSSVYSINTAKCTGLSLTTDGRQLLKF